MSGRCYMGSRPIETLSVKAHLEWLSRGITQVKQGGNGKSINDTTS